MVSVEKYPCFCGAGLKRFKSKAGRGFLKCQAETCTLFVPEEKYTDLMEGYETKVNKIFKPNNFPLCCCNEAASLWVSHSISNPDRPYFRCQDTDVDEKCEFFQWADENLEEKKVKKRKQKKSVQISTASTKPQRKRRVVKHLESSGDDEK